MKKIVLGKTGLEVSPICIGAWQLAGPLSFDGLPDGHPDPGKANVLNMIRALGERGVNFIDTAEQYGNGESERRVGEAIRGRRDRWVVSTKFGYRVGLDGERQDDSGAETIVPSIEGSLRRLGTDYIDIYLYHCPPRIDQLEAGKAVLDGLVKAGKCRFYGISTRNVSLVAAMAEREMVSVLQYPSNLLQPAGEMSALAGRHGIGTQVRGVMAQGRLSGKYFRQQPVWGGNDNRSHGTGGEDFRRYAVLEKAIPEGYTPAQAAIRWVLDDPRHHTICLGAKTLGDYEVAIEAVELPPMTPEDRRRLETCAAGLAAE